MIELHCLWQRMIICGQTRCQNTINNPKPFRIISRIYSLIRFFSSPNNKKRIEISQTLIFCQTYHTIKPAHKFNSHHEFNFCQHFLLIECIVQFLPTPPLGRTCRIGFLLCNLQFICHILFVSYYT